MTGACCVARQPQYPSGRYSALAGFVEPGELIEEAVARELMEEAGVAVGNVRYVASQPWPFPGSLMIACLAEADSDALALDRNELEDAFWVDRAGVIAALGGRAGRAFPGATAFCHRPHVVRPLDARRGERSLRSLDSGRLCGPAVERVGLRRPTPSARACRVTLTGIQEVPGPGDADGTGTRRRSAVDSGRGPAVLGPLRARQVDVVTAAHIYRGAAGIVGSPVHHPDHAGRRRP